MITDKILSGLLFYIVEFAKLFPLMFWVFDFRVRPVRKTVLYSSITLLAAAAGGIFSGENVGFLSSLMCVIGIILIMDGKLKVLYTIVVYIGICLFDMLATSIVLLFSEVNYIQLTEDITLSILMNSICIIVSLIVVLIANLIKKYTYNESGEKVSILYLILILVGELSVLIFITGFQLSNTDNKFFAVILSLSCIAFIILVVVMMINYISKKHYKNTTEINQQLLVSQENYYRMLLKKDKETIKFRHDINNHLNCMYTLFKDEKYAELNDYFENLCESMSELRPTVQTGNDIVNAILSDMISRYPDVSLKTEGRLPQKIKLSSMDLCTIYSNLFDNAFKAASVSESKSVDVYFKFAGSNLLCEIRNSVNKKAEIINNELKTDNADKINHGHGTKNALKCAEKNEGTLNFYCTDEFFTAELMLPMLH